MKKYYLAFVIPLLINILFGETITVSGRVLDKNNNPISGVNIYSDTIGTESQLDGSFRFDFEESSIITFSHIGYKNKEINAVPKYSIVYLDLDILHGKGIQISASRAIPGITPSAFSTLSKEEIAYNYTIEDVPLVLASEPGIYAYSESGNGTGYSYVSIRGFDQSKIAVMIDNVPLNDNESHQVYWVDHGDVLSDAKDVQIQRGIGNSLYGSAAFGGSINVITEITKNEEELMASIGFGSFNTKKYRVNYNTGNRLGENLGIKLRLSQIESEGYRDFHNSFQRSGLIGIEHKTDKITHQFRAQLGYENTDLTWDGIAASDINDRDLRRISYQSYTDDFYQKIYSLNSSYQYSNNLSFRNVVYLVRGKGYYEVFKEDASFYDYNLDVNDQFPDSTEQALNTGLLRRKWIVNTYYGAAPVLTWRNNIMRLDIGGELRYYSGDHFGEVSNFSNEELQSAFSENWYKYYQYIGSKTSFTGFVHLLYSLTDNLKLIGDLQYQGHRWELEQKLIGHAKGHNLSAPWNFVNPRFGLIYDMNDKISVFANYGKAQKEPADNQIIEADDVWSEPIMASAELVDNSEIGFSFISGSINSNLNIYRMKYKNEQLKNIDIKQEGEYNYYSADATIHQGIEFDVAFNFIQRLNVSFNGTINHNSFESGNSKGNILPNTPLTLGNSIISYQNSKVIQTFVKLRYVGKQFVDDNNTSEGVIDPFTLVDIGSSLKIGKTALNLKINNLFDTMYSTFGYGYEWDGYWAYFWPGATRSFYVNLAYNF